MQYRPEVEGSFPLTEAASRHQADPLLLQQAHAVVHVGFLTRLLHTNTFFFFWIGALTEVIQGDGEGAAQTFALSMAFCGSVIWGKVYMAPCTGLHLIPGTVLKVSSVSLAFSARFANTAVRSWRTISHQYPWFYSPLNVSYQL